MKKKVLALLLSVSTMFAFSGCSEASKVSHNLSLEADNFNDVLQVTVINCLQGDVLFQMTGKMSITADTSDNQSCFSGCLSHSFSALKTAPPQ